MYNTINKSRQGQDLKKLGSIPNIQRLESLVAVTLYAAKVVDKRWIKTKDQRIYTEQKICDILARQLSHSHVVQMHEVFSEKGCIYIIMEHVQGEELFTKIKKKQKIPEEQAKAWFRELIEAVSYIHKIVDLVLEQYFMIDTSSHVKLCDFGFASQIQHTDEILNTFCGSPYYAAPEMMTATPYEGPPVDLWSCGVILFVMLTGVLPFDADCMPDLVQKIKSGSFPTPRLISRNAKHLLTRLLCVDAQKRMSAEECLAHPWITQESSIHTSASMNAGLSNSLSPLMRRYHSNPLIHSPQSLALKERSPLIIPTLQKKPGRFKHLLLKKSADLLNKLF
ncbi:kinase-like domain-containing protein [Sporodiniella umbellata]|nr:kinase-like domain-containing protein [Sporodiniella umbellata]